MEIQMNNDEENKLMVQYGITSESKTVYSYLQHRYDNLKDAINFAKLDEKRNRSSESDQTE